MMKKPIYTFLLLIISIAGCQKDGTEKRCDKGYTGRNCDQEITPEKIQVTAIEATTLPPFDGSGSNWDPLGGKPDVYFQIVESLSGSVIYKSSSFSDVNTTLGMLLNLSDKNVLLNSPESKYIIQAWDYDTIDADDFMGGIVFTPYTNGKQFPSEVNIACSGCNTSWNLHFTYLF